MSLVLFSSLPVPQKAFLTQEASWFFRTGDGFKGEKKMSTVRSVEAAAASRAVHEALDLAAGNAGSVLSPLPL